MSEHVIELPESGSEKEREEELDGVTKVTHEVINPEQSEALEAESAEYAKESEVLDQRVEALERLQTLESGKDSSAPRPPRRALQKANNVRVVIRGRKKVPPAKDAGLLADAKSTAAKLAAFDNSGRRDQNRIVYDKSLDSFGASLDQAFAQRLAIAEQSSSAEVTEWINDALDKARWSAAEFTGDLVALLSSAKPGQPVDLAAAVHAAERALQDLVVLRDAIGTQDFSQTAYYAGIVNEVARGVERTLNALLDGQGLPPFTPAQRCSDLGTRLSTLGGMPLDTQQVQVNRLRTAKDTTAGRLDKARTQADQTQRDLDALAQQDEDLEKERTTASEDRKKAIDAQLDDNRTKDAALTKLLARARSDVTEEQGELKRNRDALAAAEARLQQMGEAVATGGLSFNKKSASTSWKDAVVDARKSLGDPSLSIPDQVRERLDNGIRALGADLDSQFDGARKTVQELSDTADIDALLDLGWSFSRLVFGIGTELANLDAPTGATSIIDQLRLVLAQMADYLGTLVAARSALTVDT